MSFGSGLERAGKLGRGAVPFYASVHGPLLKRREIWTREPRPAHVKISVAMCKSLIGWMAWQSFKNELHIVEKKAKTK